MIKSGVRFGKWITVSDQIGRKIYCVCDCGVHSDVFAQGLLRGNSKQCSACAAKTNRLTKPTRIVLKAYHAAQRPDTGSKFNGWTLIGPYEITNDIVWALFMCDCGKIKRRRLDYIKTGQSKCCQSCAQTKRHNKKVNTAICKKWGIVTRLFKPGLALGTIIKQKPQKNQTK